MSREITGDITGKMCRGTGIIFNTLESKSHAGIVSLLPVSLAASHLPGKGVDRSGFREPLATIFRTLFLMTTARLIRVSCFCGLLGSLLMLTGDVLFYGNWLSGRDFSSFHEMSLKPVMQLVIAGSIGRLPASSMPWG